MRARNVARRERPAKRLANSHRAIRFAECNDRGTSTRLASANAHEERQFASSRQQMHRAPFTDSLCAHELEPRGAQPARGFPVRRALAARVCLRSCARVANAPLTRTGPPSLASGGQGRRPFRYPRAR